MLKPICFMVMPFGEKTVEPRVDKAPDKIDFDALWHKAYLPVIQELGYEPVRADQDTGASIILEMLERLFFSDIVVADMTLPNGNVYYEVGIRHASRAEGCVLVSADWARPLFDVSQMRRLTFPLPEGAITDESAARVKNALRQGARALAEGTSPMYAHLPGFPDPAKVDPQRAQAIRSQLDAIVAFQTRVREARVASDKARKRALALALRDEHPASRPISQAVALELVTLLRDCAGWDEMVAYVDALPQPIRALDAVQEQRSLGLSKSKSASHEAAIAAIEDLIARRGDSSERRGLLGGRYKRLSDAARAAGDAAKAGDLLDRSIEEYEHGMRLDLNDFFPSANLPFLYRQRGSEGDAERATLTAQVCRLACERDTQSEWSKPTLLTLAFFDQDVARAKSYAKEVRRAGPLAWKLDTTVETLERSVGQTAHEATRQALEAVLADLKSLLK